MLGFLFRWRRKQEAPGLQNQSGSSRATQPEWLGSSPASRQDGYVELVGSQLRVVEPTGPGGDWPLVVPGPGVTVRCNGVVMTAPFVATKAHRIEVEVETGEQELRPRHFRVELASDRMTAELWLESAETQREVLVNPGKVRVLELKTQTVRETRPNPPVEAILSELERLGVTEGIDRAAVESLLSQPVETRGIIARGTPPTPPRDARVEWMVETGHATIVKPGTLLAKVFPSEPGKPGRDLTGNIVPPPAAPPVSITLAAGEGTTLTPDRTGIVAITEGRPAIEEQDGTIRVKIIPVLVHRDDLSANTGTIFFHGDVHVLGHVMEGTHIACDGDIWIEGNVERSLIHAGGRATLKGRVIRSRIRVGKPAAQTSGLLPKLIGLRDLLSQLETASVQVLHCFRPRYLSPR
ncbi:FapA family protein [Caldinitratiruptor microaerophilus]|uniref:Flagellar Assembly Protein A N-terminal region domain-containing protein n=1 Tax=Caldinitratiruptor microaerophilus TaxID=671077 RepID=A0AA35CL71_9FIRM|nr:FapA family protein [Caldinitratiruptor microaerophilus]BDG60564.1 hypothetical protein caldi_16540 [Caldinitratiruptor microaerophilus]